MPQMRNPKCEIRNPKQAPNSKFEIQIPKASIPGTAIHVKIEVVFLHLIRLLFPCLGSALSTAISLFTAHRTCFPPKACDPRVNRQHSIRVSRCLGRERASRVVRASRSLPAEGTYYRAAETPGTHALSPRPCLRLVQFQEMVYQRSIVERIDVVESLRQGRG